MANFHILFFSPTRAFKCNERGVNDTTISSMHGSVPTHRFQTKKQAIVVKQIDRFSILVFIKLIQRHIRLILQNTLRGIKSVVKFSAIRKIKEKTLWDRVMWHWRTGGEGFPKEKCCLFHQWCVGREKGESCNSGSFCFWPVKCRRIKSVAF